MATIQIAIASRATLDERVGDGLVLPDEGEKRRKRSIERIIELDRQKTSLRAHRVRLAKLVACADRIAFIVGGLRVFTVHGDSLGTTHDCFELSRDLGDRLSMRSRSRSPASVTPRRASACAPSIRVRECCNRATCCRSRSPRNNDTTASTRPVTPVIAVIAPMIAVATSAFVTPVPDVSRRSTIRKPAVRAAARET